MEITVNGQRYDFWDDVPDDVKRLVAQQLPDADGNAIPDLFEGTGPELLSSKVTTSTTFDVDGQTFDSVESLPPEIQELLRSLIPESGGTPAEGAAPTAPDRPLAEGEILLNGIPTRVHSDAPKQKRWWQRGS